MTEDIVISRTHCITLPSMCTDSYKSQWVCDKFSSAHATYYKSRPALPPVCLVISCNRQHFDIVSVIFPLIRGICAFVFDPRKYWQWSINVRQWVAKVVMQNNPVCLINPILLLRQLSTSSQWMKCYENDGFTLIQEKIRLQANIQKCALYIFMKMTLKQFTATQIRPEPMLLNGPWPEQSNTPPKINPLCRRYLRKDAIPSVFPNLPAYLSQKEKPVRYVRTILDLLHWIRLTVHGNKVIQSFWK